MIMVSVIVPIYNTRKWLPDCMDSLLSQSLTNCEFICVDDGSTDDSFKIVNKYIEKDKRFRLIRQENKGLSEARNVGIRNAKGKYIAFLDSDDCLQNKDVLRELLEYAEDTNVDFVTFDADCFYESDALKETSDRGEYYIRKREYGIRLTGRELFCELMENDDFCIAACILFLKREWLIKNSLWFVASLNPEDCIWCFMCYMHAKKVMHISQKYYRYRIRENSLTTEKLSFTVIYGRLYTYREILRYMFTNTLTVREENAIYKLIDIILWHMKDKFIHMDASEMYKLKELSPLDSLLARYIEYTSPDYLKLNIAVYVEGFRSVLHSASGVIIYGAGMVGQLVYQFMKREQLLCIFRGFAISDPTPEKEKIENADICWICDEELKRTDLVVVAVTRQYQNEMISFAEKAGFNHILPVDEYLLYILEVLYA